ncbi:MAG: hypothetical protein LBK06_05825 [Planctomycetaceae bacterium]|jgi:hypothetical protein|nr:hypothetical protein [Planctomycetaceae bacterium]
MSEINHSNTTSLMLEEIMQIIHKNARQSRVEYQRSKKRAREIDKEFAKAREEQERARAEAREEQERAKEEARKERERAKEEHARAMEKSREEQERAKKEHARAIKKSRKDHAKVMKEYAELRELFRQSAEQIKQTDEAIKTMSKELKEQTKRTDAELGRFGNRLGEIIEHLVAAGVADRFDEIGYHFHGVSSGNFKAKDAKGQTIAEVDVLLENDDCFIAIEVKAKPRMDDIAWHINQLKILQKYFMEHREKEKKVIGALAGAVFADHVKKAVIEKGLYAIVQSGDTIKIDVPQDFKPKLF